MTMQHVAEAPETPQAPPGGEAADVLRADSSGRFMRGAVWTVMALSLLFIAAMLFV